MLPFCLANVTMEILFSILFRAEYCSHETSMRTHFAAVSQNGYLIISRISLFDPAVNETRVAQFHSRNRLIS